MSNVLRIYALLSLLFISQAHSTPQVELGQTTLFGRDISEKVEFFGGIPFAEPPIGSLRLSHPVLKTRLSTATFNASAYGKSCLQPRAEVASMSEDCLTINVLRPSGTSSKDKLPVLFWTYGGAFVVGTSSNFDGTNLVARSIDRGTPMIYVNFNYRLAALGFPQGQEAHDHRILNLAVRDQTAALQWVRENIHFFGGDKNKVTISGVSAGAALSGVQLLNPQLPKLVRGAILQSGSPNGLRVYPAARNEFLWQDFVSRIPSCADTAASGSVLECLRSAPADELIPAMMVEPNNTDLLWGPTLDEGEGSVYPDYASRLYAKGRVARIPVLSGNNLDEGTLFAMAQETTDPDLKAWYLNQHSPPSISQTVLEDVTNKLLELYPDDPTVGSPFGTGEELFGLPSSYKRRAALVGDTWFTGPRRQLSKAWAELGLKSYGYHFIRRGSSSASQPEVGVPHGADVPYVFGQVEPTDTAGQSLSTTMMDYWISFTVSLNPNDSKGQQRPIWPQYTKEDQVVLQLDDGANLVTVKDDFRKEQIAFLNENAVVLRR